MSFPRLQRSLGLLVQINYEVDSRAAISRLLQTKPVALLLKDQHLDITGAWGSCHHFGSLAQPQVCARYDFARSLAIELDECLSLPLRPQQTRQLDWGRTELYFHIGPTKGCSTQSAANSIQSRAPSFRALLCLLI